MIDITVDLEDVNHQKKKGISNLSCKQFFLPKDVNHLKKKGISNQMIDITVDLEDVNRLTRYI